MTNHTTGPLGFTILTALTLLLAATATAGPGKTPPPPSAQPDSILLAGNNNFASAIAVGLPSGSSVNTVGAGTEAGEPTATCALTGATVWYTLTLGSTTTVTLDTFASDYDTVLAVFTGSSVSALTPVACSDDSVGLQSQVTFSAFAGVTYRIQVGGFSGATGNAILHVGTPCSGNDPQPTACVITALGFNDLQNTLGFTVEPSEAQPCGNIGATAWFRYTATSLGTINVNTFGSDFDTVVAVYIVNGNNFNGNHPQNLVCNDDASGTFQSAVSFQGVIGVSYLIQVGGFSGGTGNLNVNVF